MTRAQPQPWLRGFGACLGNALAVQARLDQPMLELGWLGASWRPPGWAGQGRLPAGAACCLAAQAGLMHRRCSPQGFGGLREQGLVSKGR